MRIVVLGAGPRRPRAARRAPRRSTRSPSSTSTPTAWRALSRSLRRARRSRATARPSASSARRGERVRPLHRLQPARGGQPRLRDARQAAVRRPDDHPHDAARRTSRPGASASSTSTSWSRPSSRRRTRSRASSASRPRATPTPSPTATVQIVEFDVPRTTPDDTLIGRPLREAAIPADSKVAGLIRGGRMIVPRGDEMILPGDRVVVIGSPDAARAWSRVVSRRGASGSTTSSSSAPGGWARRSPARCSSATSACGSSTPSASAPARSPRRCPGARCFHAHAFDPEFLERERIGRATAAVFCLNDDARNLYGAILAKTPRRAPHDRARRTTRSPSSVYERGGVDVAINPRQVTAEEMVRFAHDPRIRQIAMLDERPLRGARPHRPAPSPSWSASRSASSRRRAP